MAIIFISGVFLGAIMGVFLMAIIQVNKDHERND